MKFVLILTALAAAGVLIFVLAHEDDAVPHLSTPGGSELHADPAKPNRDPQSGESTESRQEEGRDTETSSLSRPSSTPESRSDDATSSSASPSELEELVAVRVVDRVTKEALAGVEVTYTTIEDLEAYRRQHPQGLKSGTRLIGRSQISDAEGLVRFPAQKSRGVLFAQTATHKGAHRVGLGGQELEFPLGPCATVLVRVVDTQGRPEANFEVVLRERRGQGDETTCRDESKIVADKSDGFARLVVGDLDQRSGESRHSIALCGLFETPVEMPIDLSDLPTEPITLVMPDCGSLSVSLTKGGQRVLETDPGIVMVSTTEEFERSMSWLDTNPGMPYQRSDKSYSQAVSASEETVPRIGLGLELTVDWVSTRYRGPSAATSRRVTLTGPTRPGEVVPIVLELPEDKTIHVRGRILEKDGYPNAWVHVTATLEYRQAQEETAPSNPSFKTDTEGRFEFEALLLVEESRGEPWLVFRRQGRLSEKVVHEFRIDPKGEPEIDLGDLILFDTLDQRRRTILAAGRVVDEEGRGLAMTQLSLKPIVSDEEQKAGQLAFSQTAFSGDDGSFQFQGDSTATSFLLRVSSWKHGAEPMSVGRGQRDILVRCSKNARLEGRVKTTPGSEGLLAQLEVGAGPPGEPIAHRSSISEDGGLILHVRPGIHDIVIWHKEREDQILWRNTAQLESGETHDLGTIRIEVPGVLLALDVEVPKFSSSEASAVNLVRMSVFSDGPDAEPLRRSGHDHNGPILLLVPQLPVDIEFDVPGCRRKRLTITERETRVRMQRGYEVRLHVPELEDLPDGAHVRLGLRDPRLRGMASLNDGEEFPAPEGTAMVICRNFGPHVLQVMVGKKTPRFQRFTGVHLGQGIEVEVEDQDGVQDVRIEFGEAWMREIRAQLEKL